MYDASWCNLDDTDTFISSEMCCICGGGSYSDDTSDGDEDQTGECTDTNNGVTDAIGDDCAAYTAYPS
jgi:hypothetical protein